MSLYKIIISFDVEEEEAAGASQRYFVQNIAPIVQHHEKMYVGEIWWTLWGDIPQFLGGIVVESLDVLKELLHSSKWQDAITEFKNMVENLEVRVVCEAI